MHRIWQISPAPAVHVAPPTSAGGAPRCLVNDAAARWPTTVGWTAEDWQRLARSILAAVSPPRGAPAAPDPRAETRPDDATGADPATGIGWRVTPWADGHLAWLLEAESGGPTGAGATDLAERLDDLTERLDVAQEFGRIGIWVRDARTGRGRWDPHTFRLFGLAESDGTPDFVEATAGIHPDDQARVREVYQASLARAGRYETHFRVVRPGGTLIRVRSTWRVEGPDGGRPLRAIGVLVDETEHLEALQRHALALQQLNLAGGLVGITLWRWDMATRRVQFNTVGHAFSRVPRDPDGIPVDTVRQGLHPDDVEPVQRAAEQAVRGTAAVDVRARFRDGEGRYRDLLTRRVAQRDDQGQVIALIGVSMDMTQQVADRARGDAFSARMHLVAEATGIGVWSFDLDTGERHWNGQMRRLFGVAEGEPLPSLRRSLEKVVVPEDRPKVDAMVRRIELASAQAMSSAGPAAPPAEGTPEDGEVVEVEFRIHPPGGPLCWLVTRTQVLRQGAQAIAHGVLIDVTEFRAAQVELKLANSRVELAAQAAGLGTWQLDIDTGIVHWDAQMYRLRGLSPDDPRPVQELIRSLPPQGDDPQVDAKVVAAIEGPAGYANEFRVRWPDGSVHWLASRGMTVAGPDGRVDRMFGVNWDITEQKRAEQMQRDKLMAEESSRAKSDFLARMSHELRTPLNAVLGFSELLVAALPERIGDQERAHAELIRSAGRHLLALIDDVLDLARIDADKLPLDQESVSLDAVLSDVVRWVQVEARTAGVTVQAEAGGGWVRGDAKGLRQVFANLLSNGIKYNRAGGSVRVRVAPGHGAWTVVRVVDTGRGMGPEQLAHLFEPFNRLGAERGEIQGTGIGLAIVHQLVERMGGRIAVDSGPGQGAVFTLTLPGAEAPPGAALAVGQGGWVPAPPPSAAPAAPDGTRAPLTALYIEDNPVNLLLVRELFERKPAWVLHTATTGAEGIAEAMWLRPRLALIDMQLPDMNGEQVLARLRIEPDLRGLCCIALSANAMPDDVARAREAGFDDYWTKPIDFEGFLAALDTIAADLSR